ncbi:MAG: hypothetical protein HQL31_11330, partial [Planctomycetes bacterium]|nr:hypothetical protein [Planctomycetota bacterium]
MQIGTRSERAEIVFSIEANLGIGTLTPSANLHVAGNVRLDEFLILGNMSSAPGSSSGNGQLYTLDGNLYFGYGSDSSSNLSDPLWTLASGNAYRATGSVGIGSTEPSAKLDVSGSAYIAGNLLLSDGTASLPALVFASDKDSGLFLGSSGNLVCAIDGSEKFSLDAEVLFVKNLQLKTDRWQEIDTNTFLGVQAQGAGNLAAGGTDNTALGYQALFSNEDNVRAVAIGHQALKKMATGTTSNNVAIGHKAMSENTGGDEMVAVGFEALRENTSGRFNTAAGSGALQNNTSGLSNAALGFQAMRSETTGPSGGALGEKALYSSNGGLANNTACGANTLYNNTTGIRNTAIGLNCLGQASASYNNAVGYNSLANAIGSNNSGFGAFSLFSNAGGTNNVALGYASLHYDQGGSSNCAVGHEAGAGIEGSSNTSNNSLLGFRAGHTLTTGGNNILIGYRAGDNLGTGSRNIIIGHDLDAPSANSDDHLNIGDVIYGDLSVLNIGIGTATP